MMEAEPTQWASSKDSDICDHENGIEDRKLLLKRVHESDSRYSAHVQEMALLCQTKDEEICGLNASYAESLQEISRLKSQIEQLTSSCGVTRGEMVENDSSIHPSKGLAESQKLHERMEKEIATKKAELRKLLECIERKEKVVHAKRGELIKVLRTKNVSLLHLERQITMAKKSRVLLDEKLAQGELKLKLQQEQIERQEKHEANGSREALTSLVPMTSLSLVESKECDTEMREDCSSFNERAMRYCISFRTNYSDMTSRVSILVQQLKRLQGLLQMSLTEKEQIGKQLERIREKYKKQAKAICDLKAERDQLLSKNSHSVSVQKASRHSQRDDLNKSSCNSLHLVTSNGGFHFELAHLEKKHADIIQKNNWNKELKDFINEVLEYAKDKEEELQQIKQGMQVSAKDMALPSDPTHITLSYGASETATNKLVEELQMKERTLLNLMEQLRLCQQKCSHLLEENQEITSKNVELSDRYHTQDTMQQKITELEMKNSHLVQLKNETNAEKEALMRKHEELFTAHETTLAEVEDFTKKLAASEKDKEIMEGILQEVSKELVSVEQDKAELIFSLEDLRKRQNGSFHDDEPQITEGSEKQTVMSSESYQKTLPDVCSPLTSTSNASLLETLHPVSISYRQGHLTPPISEVYIPGVQDVLTVNSNNSSSVGLSPARFVPEPKSCVAGTLRTKITEAKPSASSIRYSSRCDGFLPNFLVCLLIVLLLLLITVNISAPSSNFLFEIFEPYFEHTKINNIY